MTVPARVPPKLIVFDCDGVLVDSEGISNAVLARMLSEAGLPRTTAEARRDYQGWLLRDIVADAESQLGRALPEGWLERYERDREGAFRRELKAVPGALEALASANAAGVQVCVASQGKLAKTRLSLELTGLRAHFAQDALFSAESVGRGKPHPDLFLHAAATMAAAPAECVVVEDTPSGVAAGVAAGMRVYGLCADSDEVALREAGAAEIVRTMYELPARLGLGPAKP